MSAEWCPECTAREAPQIQLFTVQSPSSFLCVHLGPGLPCNCPRMATDFHLSIPSRLLDKARLLPSVFVGPVVQKRYLVHLQTSFAHLVQALEQELASAEQFLVNATATLTVCSQLAVTSEAIHPGEWPEVIQHSTRQACPGLCYACSSCAETHSRRLSWTLLRSCLNLQNKEVLTALLNSRKFNEPEPSASRTCWCGEMQSKLD